MPIRLHDSLTRTTRELAPAQPDGVFRFYNCGPTVYAPAHIGNFRTFVVNDLVRRLLELEFGPGKVRHVRNITDVDDKTIRRSRDEKRPLSDVTRQWTEKFHADCDALNCLRPHEEPRATDPRFMREQVDMINVLLEKGNAYRTADGSVYFKVSSYPGYGALSRVRERELKLGTALAGKPEAAAHDSDEKEDGSDFALWKAHKPDDGDVQWPGPAGAAAGRPGWHIECSAMSKALLGPTIDLHTGGVDLLFPHHENEIAQSQCCNGAEFSRHWYHSEHLLVDGRKMSKSLNNLYTLDQLRDMGHGPMALRYALLAGHPRKQLNFTLDSLHAAEKNLAALRAFAATLPPALPPGVRPGALEPVLEALRDDLNTPAALGALFTAVNRGADAAGIDAPAFTRILFALGLKLDAPAGPKAEVPAEVATLAEQRWAAKKAKDFAAADQLRARLAASGWAMLDGKDGYKLEPAKK
ncbi:cysteine--tRNA ligase [Termitidicoccus mucosus]|uniref:Cysteine--tRNA ligase n=1 Tax=Termitidicoccus mucosus TaxID=1184151 RepID=A0A178IDD8_9BACT|nr:cysteine--tRNA ligase [Opitutaceae bacterium TSB47]